DLFDESTIATLLQHFTDLAGRFANAAEQPVSAMSLLSVEDIARLSGYKAQQIEAVYPLTAMQQDMVMSQWMNPDSLANTLGYRAELNTWVDDQLWQQACQQTCNAE